MLTLELVEGKLGDDKGISSRVLWKGGREGGMEGGMSD